MALRSQIERSGCPASDECHVQHVPTSDKSADAGTNENASGSVVTPFLKWPGGKRWLVTSYPELFPKQFNRYIEPFLGAGSVFFHLRPNQALLGDINPDVITAFRGIKNDPEGVVALLKQYHACHSKHLYYEVRDGPVPTDPTAQAARIIYLNRTCFNGIYRVNRRGKFNVPIGTKTNVLLDSDDFDTAARLLSNADLVLGDFEPLIDSAREGDLVFLDPPYTVRHNRNGFVKYNEALFSWTDQERLAAAATRAALRGVFVIVTNAAHDSVRDLYRDDVFHFRTVSRTSPIAASPSSRKRFEELVITNKCGGTSNEGA